ncbi:MAG: hypothetical protein KDA79_22290 [Planctomycetaceae bacterium]|nr:hypothetical protein [Planctomycetaceae bacterium]
MDFRFDDPFRDICQQILDQNKTPDEWSEIESDDMFQHGPYCGGFDATEGEFCFSLYREDGEFWFQVSLEQVRQIVGGRLKYVTIRPSES